MRKRWLAMFALCVLAALGTTATAGQAAAPASPPAMSKPAPDISPTPDPIAPVTANSAADFVIVQYSGGASREAQTADGKEPSLEEQGFRHLQVPAGMTREQFLAQLQSDPQVLSAVPDAQVEAAAIPDDPSYRNQEQYLNLMNAPDAWDLETGSDAITVAVLDSGLDLTHPEFAGRLWENPKDSSNDGIDHDQNKCINDRYGCRYVTLTTSNVAACGYTPSAATGDIGNGNVSDDNESESHGTFVSGIIGAAGNNGIGVTGIAWNVKLMTVKVLDCGSGAGGAASGSMYDVAYGIDYARRMGAKIINMSLSCVQQSSCDVPILRTAIAAAQAEHIILVAAAGNYGSKSQPGPGYPGAYTDFPNLITVGAANNLSGDTWASYSSYGPALDFAAPAQNISSTIRTDSPFASPYGTESSGGTSFAAPLVSGMFALMMSRNSGLSDTEYIQIARDAATPAPPAPHGGNWAGSGIINIGAAVARVPMTVDGAPLHDWMYLPAGTPVRATIDGVECGVATTDAFGVATHYHLRVKSAAEKPGCGEPGKTVQISLGGVPAQPTIRWGVRNEELGVIGRDLTTVSPPPGSLVVQTLNGSWSNIAQLDPSGTLPSALSALPTPWTAAYRWDPTKAAFDGTTGAFQRFLRGAPAFVDDWTSAKTYDAFWVDAPASNVASLNPNPEPGRVIQLQAGWNNFVYTGTSKAVSDALSALAGQYSEVLQYDNAGQQWLVYIPGQPRYLEDFGGLFTLKVYWIYVAAPAQLTMG